jgi:YgiT-type zinc finger domain-containing protein
MKCPTCEIGNLVEGVRDVPYTYKDNKTILKAVKGRFCDNRKYREVVMDKDESARTRNARVQQESVPLLTRVSRPTGPRLRKAPSSGRRA